jgi:hypothetical protein
MPCIDIGNRKQLFLDGYLSADAGNGGGPFVTPPLVFSGNRLALNADTGARGLIEIGLEPVESDQGAWMPALTDFPADACDQIVGNSVRRVVRWNGNENVSSLAGKPVRMHVRMRNAKSCMRFSSRNESRVVSSPRCSPHMPSVCALPSGEATRARVRA